jgi:hypothetical protein
MVHRLQVQQHEGEAGMIAMLEGMLAQLELANGGEPDGDSRAALEELRSALGAGAGVRAAAARGGTGRGVATRGRGRRGSQPAATASVELDEATMSALMDRCVLVRGVGVCCRARLHATSTVRLCIHDCQRVPLLIRSTAQLPN